MLSQGLVLLVAGMGIVYVFLMLLVLVTNAVMPLVAKANGLFPEEAPRKAPAARKAAADDADLALALAVALGK